MIEYRVKQKIQATAFCLLSASVLAACNTLGASGPKPTIKQAVETAPADLQLACSSEVANRFPDSGNVLPLSSGLLGADVFRVRITAQTGSYVCDINRAGNIVSLLPAAESTDQIAVDQEAIKNADKEPQKKKKIKLF